MQSPLDTLEKLFAYLNNAYGTPKPDMDLERDFEQIVALSKEEVYKKSLANLFPELLSEWDYEKNGRLTPDLISAGSCKGVWWKCQACHGSWKTAPNNRAGDCKTGCPYCAGSKVLPGYNDLQTKYPDLAKQWHPTKNGSLLPSMVMPKSGKSVWWVGECGHEWDMPIVSRTSLAFLLYAKEEIPILIQRGFCNIIRENLSRIKRI